jgi:hypothetical protein
MYKFRWCASIRTEIEDSLEQIVKMVVLGVGAGVWVLNVVFTNWLFEILISLFMQCLQEFQLVIHFDAWIENRN